MKNVILLLLLPWIGNVRVIGQDVFNLNNPSFEADKSQCCTVPEGWMDLGAENESPPDIQPGSFNVVLQAQDGKQYLGMVVRDNNTWEGVGQKLNGFLKKDSSYRFSVYLSRSNAYQSLSRATGKEVNYNAPTCLKIWGVNHEMQTEELLAQSSAVGHSEWTLYTFTLKPTVSDFDEIDLMAYYGPGYEKTNGNLLIDNCSTIQKIND